MPKVSVIIPTCNRPELLKKAIGSVLAQDYDDFEIVVVDDGTQQRAENVVTELNDKRIKYIQHKESRGGGAARNTGIKAAEGNFIAFLDDDDQWLPEKLKSQMLLFEKTPHNVGFCFSAVENVYDNRVERTFVPDGVDDYFDLLLRHFSGFLTVTLIIKRYVFEDAGMFDESYPSHQETDLLMRIMKKYKGIGINRPFVRVNMKQGHSTKGLSQRIRGKEMLIKNYYDDFAKDKKNLARQYFLIGLLYRDNGEMAPARSNFKRALDGDFRILYLLHYLSLSFSGVLYKLFR